MKKVVALGVGLLMMGTASQAMASFERGHLSMTIYDTANNYEMGLDLGSYASLTGSNVTLYSGLSFTGWNFAYMTTGVGVFMDSSDTNEGIYSGVVGTNRSTGLALNTYYAGGDSFNDFSEKVRRYYSTADTDGDGIVLGTATFASSYVVNMQNGKNGEAGTPGFYTGINQQPTAEVEFPVSNPYVDIYLYQWDTNMDTGELYVVGGTSYTAIIRLTATGDVIFNPTQASEVPVPGAVWLLGSGLMGLAGLRRRNNG